MKKGVGLKVSLLVILVISIITLSTFVLAEGEVCLEDNHCADYSDTLVCDLALYVCVEDTSTGEEDSTDADASEEDTTSDTAEDDDSEDSTSTTDTSELEADIDSNSESIATIEADVDLLESQLSGLDTRLATVETTTSTTKTSVAAIETSVSNLEITTSDIESQLDTLNTNIQLLSTDQNQLERNVEQEVNTLEAQVGNSIALLEQEIETAQEDLGETKTQLEEQAKKSKNFRTFTLIVAVIAIFSTLAYFLMIHSKRHSTLPQDVKEFITSQIKLGKTKTQIITTLKQSGWTHDDASWAYDHTKTDNYNAYLISQGKDPKTLPARKIGKGHHQKALAISIISIFVLAVMLFFVKNSVGNAIYVTGTGSQADLEESVESLLESYIDQNSFYDAIEYVELCVQVDDKEHSSSWQVLKTPYGHSVSENDPCEWDPTDYDFAVKFTNYASFESVITSVTCTTTSLSHQVLSGSSVTRGVYVLPSYFIEEGMSTKSSVDYSDYCNALSLCFSDEDIETLGVNDC